jgi:uncharacterized protein YgiM (DUF1202 family)
MWHSTANQHSSASASAGQGCDPEHFQSRTCDCPRAGCSISIQRRSDTKSRTTSAPSWAAPIPAATPQYFARAPQYYPRAPQYYPRPRQFPRAIPVQTPTPFGADVAAATPVPVTYRVVKISQADYLNVRTGAGSTYPILMKLDPGTAGIVLGTNRVANAETMWQEIIVNGRTGWVNVDYIAPETQSVASP